MLMPINIQKPVILLNKYIRVKFRFGYKSSSSNIKYKHFNNSIKSLYVVYDNVIK